jgi:ABC-type sugar transport system substrate-binding protein
LLAAVVAGGGCDSGSFIPPPPPELRGTGPEALPANSAAPALDGSETALAGGRPVELVLGRHTPAETAAFTAAARVQAGHDTVKLKVESLGEADLPVRQADLVRDALTRNPLAVVVEPADPADLRLTDALHAAQAKGVPIVLLNRPLAGGRTALASVADHSAESVKGSGRTNDQAGPAAGAGRRPVVLVATAPFLPSANQLISSAFRNAKNGKLDPRGGALIVINSKGDFMIEDRVSAIRSALRGSLVTAVDEIRFSDDLEAGARLVVERLRAKPKLAMVFSVDSLSSAAIRHAKDEIVSERPFVIAGYAAEENYSELAQYAEFAAVAEFAPLRVVRRAITTAVALARGRELPGRIEIPIVVNDSPETAGVPKSHTRKESTADASKPSF